MKRGERECKKMPDQHPWRFHLCTCGANATHVCATEHVEFAVACEWHAFRWVREA